MTRIGLRGSVAAIALLMVGCSHVDDNSESGAGPVHQLEFGTFASAEMVEQDVFIASTEDNGQVTRVAAANLDTHLKDELFGVAGDAPPFQPMLLEPTETYPKGSDLGITLEEWLSAEGTGTYQCNGDQATISFQFRGLIPNGIYTVWNFIDAEPPTDPWQSLVWALGARDGSQAEFTADADGNAQFEAVVSPCPELSGSQTFAGFAIAWHSDGKTYGAYHGDLGVVSHVQLSTGLPQH